MRKESRHRYWWGHFLYNTNLIHSSSFRFHSFQPRCWFEVYPLPNPPCCTGSIGFYKLHRALRIGRWPFRWAIIGSVGFKPCAIIVWRDNFLRRWEWAREANDLGLFAWHSLWLLGAALGKFEPSFRRYHPEPRSGLGMSVWSRVKVRGVAKGFIYLDCNERARFSFNTNVPSSYCLCRTKKKK